MGSNATITNGLPRKIRFVVTEMSEQWCKDVSDRLKALDDRMANMEKGNAQLLKIVVLGLLAIAGAVVGVKLLP